MTLCFQPAWVGKLTLARRSPTKSLMGLAASSQPLAPPVLYRPRNARATALYQLLEAYYEDVKSVWEQCFEKKYGFWRGFVDQVVARYLDCGSVEAFRETPMRRMWCGKIINAQL